MRVIRGLGPPGDSDVPTGDSHDYATWDAAYVLGSLVTGRSTRVRGAPERLPVV